MPLMNYLLRNYTACRPVYSKIIVQKAEQKADNIYTKIIVQHYLCIVWDKDNTIIRLLT